MEPQIFIAATIFHRYTIPPAQGNSLSKIVAMLGNQWLNWYLRNSGGSAIEHGVKTLLRQGSSGVGYHKSPTVDFGRLLLTLGDAVGKPDAMC